MTDQIILVYDEVTDLTCLRVLRDVVVLFVKAMDVSHEIEKLTKANFPMGEDYVEADCSKDDEYARYVRMLKRAVILLLLLVPVQGADVDWFTGMKWTAFTGVRYPTGFV